MEKFMPQLSENDRIQALQDTADKVRQESYDAPLSDAEIENRNADFYKTTTQMWELEYEKKEILKDFAEKIGEKKAECKAISIEIRTRSTKKDGILYDLANLESGYMETYDKTGELIEKRRLTPQEKKGQSRMFVPDSLKTGTNDK